MMNRLLRLTLAITALALSAFGAWSLATAQEDDSEEKGAFVRYVEDTISTPDRKISLGQIDGALSSDVRISSITISDSEGVWLTIEDAHLVWSRLALLRGRLDIDLLEAASITVDRTPGSSDTAPAPAASEPFALPDLPVEVLIDRLAVPRVALAEPVIGEAAELSVEGAVNLAGGSLDSKLAIERTDGKPGQLTLAAAFSNEDRRLALDLAVEEPEDGVIANSLGIPDRPAVRFTVKGDGPLDDFKADIALAAAGRDLLSGAVTLSAVDGGMRFLTDLQGALSTLFPAEYAAYFQGTSTLAIDAVRADDGSVAIDRASIRSGVADLQLNGRLATDGFPTAIALSGTLDAGGESIPLPGAADTASIGGARFSVDFGGASDAWSARFDLSGLDTSTLSADNATIVADGMATNLADPATRAVSATVDGALAGVSADDPDLASALGDRFDIAAKAAWSAGKPVDVEIAEVKNPNAAVHFAGSIDGLVADGRTWLNAADVAPFAGLAGQTLSGSLTFESRGTVDAGTGAFDLVLDGVGQDLAVGIAKVDPLLAGETRVSGRASRTTGGLSFDDLSVATPRLTARLDGGYDLDRADLALDARLDDLAALAEGTKGPVSIAAKLSGSGTRPDVAAAVTSPGLTLEGHRLTEARIGFDGSLETETSAVAGALTLSGFLDSIAVEGGARIESLADGTRKLSDIAFTAAGTRIEGDLVIAPDGLASGRLAVASPDVSAVAPLALVDAAGALDATIQLAATDGRQDADVVATAKRLRVETIVIGEAAVDLSARDLTGVPAVDGRIAASAIEVGGTRVDRVDATARHHEQTTDFEASAKLEQGDLQASGALTAVESGFDVALDRFLLERGRDLSARLLQPVTVEVRSGAVTLPATTIAVGSGRITAEGRIADTLALDVVLEKLPLALANAVDPSLGAGGLLSGTLTVSGTQAAPQADYRISADRVTAAALSSAGVPALAVRASGRYAGDAVTVDGSASGGGLDAKVSGRVPLSGGALDLSVDGKVPLGLADRFLSERGARVRGDAILDLSVGGTLSAPRVSGAVSVDQASLVDPETATRLNRISARITLDGDRAVIERLRGVLNRKGRISVTGSVGIAAGSGYPADLAIVIDDTRFTDGRIVSADVDGRLTVTGPLVDGPRVAGEIRIDRAEITVPETLPGNASFLDVRHRLPPPNVERTLEHVRETLKAETGGAGAGGGLVLDISIVAPSQVFVRGRGIDAELGGSVRVTGPIDDVRPVGALSLIRGRVVVVGQRIQFDRGTVTLLGDLDPVLDFVATTRSDTIEVTAQISGVASNPTIALTSVPQLPQDEVLSRLLFGRGINELSPLQIASLAAAVAELAGAGGGPGILDQLRKSTGLDDLEVVTDSEGNAAVQAGRYVTDNVYLGVTAGPSGQASVSVNLDITDDLKASVEVDPKGGSKVGVFYETEY